MSDRDDTARALAEQKARMALDGVKIVGDATMWSDRLVEGAGTLHELLTDTIEAAILEDRAERAKDHIEKAHELAAEVYRAIVDHEDWDHAAYIIAQALAARAERGGEAGGWVRERNALADIFNSCCYSAMADVTRGDLESRLGDIAAIANEAVGPLSNPFPAPPPAEEGGEGE